MSTKRYYFPDYIEDDVLGILAVQAAELLRSNANIMAVFKRNNMELYGQSPKKTLFLMKQNNISIFTPSPNKESNPGKAKPNQGLFTPPIRNPDIRNIPRRHLSFDSDSGTFDPNSPIRHQSVSPREKPERTLDPTTESNKQLVKPSISTMNPKGNNEESPRSAEIARMTSNLTMAETNMESHEKVTDNTESSKQESPQSAKTTSNPTVLTEETRSILQEYLATGLSFLRAFSPEKPKISSEKPKESVDPDSISKAQVIAKIPNPILFRIETPSPVKKSKMDSKFLLASPGEKIGVADSSPEDTSPIQIDKINLSPNQGSAGKANEDRKIKSISPKQRGMTIFRSMPRVIKSVGEAEIDVEVPFTLEENASPSTSRSSPADNKNDALKAAIPIAGETKTVCPKKRYLKENVSPSEKAKSEMPSLETSEKSSPVSCEEKTDSSPQIGRRHLSPYERVLLVSSSRDAEKSTVSGEDVSVSELPPSSVSSPAEVTVQDSPCKIESRSSNIDIDAVRLTNSVLRFNTLLTAREQFLGQTLTSLVSFKGGVELVSSYVNNAGYIVSTIGTRINEYSLQELKDSVNGALATVTKLTRKLNPWKKDLNSEIETWHKFFNLLQKEKVKYEPILSKEGKPNLSAEDLQRYECKMKHIWRKLDDMILMSDVRRALFSNIGYDMVRLMQNLVKCLVHVGILLPR